MLASIVARPGLCPPGQSRGMECLLIVSIAPFFSYRKSLWVALADSGCGALASAPTLVHGKEIDYRGKVDSRADLYSLSAVWFELVEPDNIGRYASSKHPWPDGELSQTAKEPSPFHHGGLLLSADNSDNGTVSA